MERIVGRGLVGHDVGARPARPHPREDLGDDLGRIAEEPHRARLARGRPARDERQRLVERLRLLVEIAGAQPGVDPALVAFDREAGGAGHHRGERLRAAHAAETRRQHPAAGEIAAILLAPHLGEGLVGALHDALRADIDPAAGRHLAVHHEPLAVELVEMLPGGPVRHEVGIGDQHPRRILVGAEDADRAARLHEQRLVGLERAERRHDPVEILPAAGGAADPAIDHQLVRTLGHIGWRLFISIRNAASDCQFRAERVEPVGGKMSRRL